MDSQRQHGTSPASGQGQGQQPSINQTNPSSSNAFTSADPTSLGFDLNQQQQFNGAVDSSFDSFNANDFMHTQPVQQQQNSTFGQTESFDPSASFSQQPAAPDPSLGFNSQSQNTFLPQNLGEGDFSLFPPGGQSDQFNAPLFEQSSLSPNDMNSMASPHSPSSPGLLQQDSMQHPGSSHQSPSYSHQQFSPSNTHSRNVSLGPEAALLPGQINEWSQPQFQGHRRSPSEYSDVSSVSHSPHLLSSDSFDPDTSGHSPLQRASDGSLYQEVLGISDFTINDPHGRSPSHSPAISPRISPQNLPDINQQQFNMMATYGNTPNYPTMQMTSADYGAIQTSGGTELSPMAAPSINIDFAPNNAKPGEFGSNKSHLDQDSLLPPERGRAKSRPRSVTDPFQPGTMPAGRSNSQGAATTGQSLGADLAARQDTSRSLSPLDRRSAASRRRQSTSAVPNNVIALRLADPDYQNSQESGSSKRVQKHPATFQCTLCTKRFTRAYNLRSHLRTHTDERPFVCTVCGKAFARQHDRKRHESLHSGEKKFVCKGDLKAGGQWGCGRRFARADALGRHFRSEAGRICIKPLLDEEMLERQRAWQEQRMQQNLSAQQNISLDPGSGYPMDNNGNYALPAALLAQYPALAQMNWSAPDMSGGMEDDLSGRSSFEASDYEGDDGGYVSGPGTGYGEGGMAQNFGEMGYASDLGGQ